MELCTVTSPPKWSQTSPLFCVHFSTTLLAFTGKFSTKWKKFWSLQPSIHINVESTWKQRWLSTFINFVSTLIFGWKWKLSRRTFIDVVSTLAKQRSNKLTRRFNVDELKLFQRWNLVENESWADICLSTLFQRWQNNVGTALTELRWFNVDDPMLFQR